MQTETIVPTQGSPKPVLTAQILNAAILDSGRIALELQETAEAVSSERQGLEKYLYEIYHQDSSRALLALGLAEPSFGFSPSVEFWRGFSGLFVHALLVAPETEKLRERIRVELTPEEAGNLLGRVPPMTGGVRLKPPLQTPTLPPSSNARKRPPLPIKSQVVDPSGFFNLWLDKFGL